jgi:nucleoprotein TPR
LQDKLRADAAKIRASDAQKAAADLTAAVEKVRTEMQTTTAPPDEQVKKLQEELRTTEQRLREKHQEDLKAAVEAAKKEASSAAASGVGDGTVAAAIAAHDKEREAKLQEEIAAAVERGRMEGSSKVKLKDAQILRIQNRLKEYEAQILAWKEAGVLPQDAKLPGPVTKPPQPNPSVANAATTSNTPAASSTPVTSNNLPRKPPVQSTSSNPAAPSAGPSAASTSTPAPAAGAGRGRGVAPTTRGTRGLPIRGAAAGRGAPAATAKPGQPLSGGVQIHGAANGNKRPAVEPAESDSLAKRLKPAAVPGGPVKLNRPGPPPPS